MIAKSVALVVMAFLSGAAKMSLTSVLSIKDPCPPVPK